MQAARTLDFLVLCNITKRVLYFIEIVVRETQAILREKVSELVNRVYKVRREHVTHYATRTICVLTCL